MPPDQLSKLMEFFEIKDSFTKNPGAEKQVHWDKNDALS